jgi:hypothetical protein
MFSSAASTGQDVENAIWQHMPYLRPLKSDEFGKYQDRAAVRPQTWTATGSLSASASAGQAKKTAE